MATINAQVASSAADAREVSGGTVTLTDPAINLAAGAHRAFFHLPAFGLPVGALVTSATPQARLVTDDDPDCAIYVENVDSSAVPTGTAFEISGRTYTSGVPWSGANQGTSDFVNLPDISVPLQVWANRAGRTPGSNLGIMIQGSGSSAVQIRTYDFSPSLAFKLTVTYELPGDGAEYSLVSYGAAVY